MQSPLHDLRNSWGYNRQEMANILGISYHAYVRTEAGNQGITERLSTALRALGVDTANIAIRTETWKEQRRETMQREHLERMNQPVVD